MSQNRREEEQGQKETERRRMKEDDKIKNEKKNQMGPVTSPTPTPRSILPLKHGQRRAAGKWRRESRSKSAPMKEEAK